MNATLTTKGQITIPVRIRRKLNLKPGDVLEFDENTPYLKASKAIPAEAWEALTTDWEDPYPDLSPEEVLNLLRGPVDLPGGSS